MGLRPKPKKDQKRKSPVYICVHVYQDTGVTDGLIPPFLFWQSFFQWPNSLQYAHWSFNILPDLDFNFDLSLPLNFVLSTFTHTDEQLGIVFSTEELLPTLDEISPAIYSRHQYPQPMWDRQQNRSNYEKDDFYPT